MIKLKKTYVVWYLLLGAFHLFPKMIKEGEAGKFSRKANEVVKDESVCHLPKTWKRASNLVSWTWEIVKLQSSLNHNYKTIWDRDSQNVPSGVAYEVVKDECV